MTYLQLRWFKQWLHKEITEEVHTFAIVGAALEISETTVASGGGGGLFCFLLLPPETKTKLPVHINGVFSLSDGRRGLKWPGQERKDDSDALELLDSK